VDMTNRTTACVNGCTYTTENTLYVVRGVIDQIDRNKNKTIKYIGINKINV